MSHVPGVPDPRKPEAAVPMTRDTLRARARAAGMLVVPDRPRSAPTYAELLAASEGAGSAVSEALAAERASR